MGSKKFAFLKLTSFDGKQDMKAAGVRMSFFRKRECLAISKDDDI